MDGKPKIMGGIILIMSGMGTKSPPKIETNYGILNDALKLHDNFSF